MEKKFVKIFSLHKSRWHETKPEVPLVLIDVANDYATIGLLSTGNQWLDRANVQALEEVGIE